jgi:hypothetical protein
MNSETTWTHLACLGKTDLGVFTKMMGERRDTQNRARDQHVMMTLKWQRQLGAILILSFIQIRRSAGSVE